MTRTYPLDDPRCSPETLAQNAFVRADAQKNPNLPPASLLRVLKEGEAFAVHNPALALLLLEDPATWQIALWENVRRQISVYTLLRDDARLRLVSRAIAPVLVKMAMARTPGDSYWKNNVQKRPHAAWIAVSAPWKEEEARPFVIDVLRRICREPGLLTEDAPLHAYLARVEALTGA